MHMVRVGPILLVFLAARAFQHLSSTTVASHIGCVSPPFRLQAVPIDFSVRLLCSAAQGFPKGTAQPRPSFHFNGSAFVGRWVWGRHCCRAQRWTWLDLYPHVGSFGKRSFGPRHDSRFSEPWALANGGEAGTYLSMVHIQDIVDNPISTFVVWHARCFVLGLICCWIKPAVIASDILFPICSCSNLCFCCMTPRFLLVKSSTISNWISLFVAPSPPGVAAMQAQWWGQAPQEQIFILVLCSVLGDHHWWWALRSITDDGFLACWSTMKETNGNGMKWHKKQKKLQEIIEIMKNWWGQLMIQCWCQVPADQYQCGYMPWAQQNWPMTSPGRNMEF